MDSLRRRTLSPHEMVGIGVAVYLIWTLATYLLEGRVHLLITGDPVGRLAYALIANLLIGTAGVFLIASRFRRDGNIEQNALGFQAGRRTLSSIAAAFVIGGSLFILQSPPTFEPVVVLNLFAQVFTTSTAEILVIYVLVGTAVAGVVRPHGQAPSVIAGIAVSAILFGAYHIAHSPPFNTLSMILLLTGIGVITGLFFFLVREVYATIVFHNFLALFGVMQSIDPAGFRTLNLPLLAMMLLSIMVLVTMDLLVIRRRGGDGTSGRG